MVNHSIFPPIVVNKSAGNPSRAIMNERIASIAAQAKLNNQHGGSPLIVPQAPGATANDNKISKNIAEILATAHSNAQYDKQSGGSMMNRLELLLGKNKKSKYRKNAKAEKTQKRKKNIKRKNNKTEKRKKHIKRKSNKK